MKITKLGHCCLVIEEGAGKVLFDPGVYSTAQQEVRGLQAIIITHEHQDHYHLDSLKMVLANNPDAKVFTNSGVGKLLAAAGIVYELIEHGQRAAVAGLVLEAFGDQHASMLPYVPLVVNTGFLVGGRFFYPGDAFTNPGQPVETLALPVVGPWLKLVEAIDYAKALRPQHCFPVHDGMLKIFGPVHALPQKALLPLGIEFRVPELGVPFEV